MGDHIKPFKGIIPPPVVFGGLVILGFIVQKIFPLNFLFIDRAIRLLAAFPLFTAAGLVALSAVVVMKKGKTAIAFHNHSTKFIVRGAFRFTRNPLYLSLLMLMAGIAVIADSAWHLVAGVFLFLYLNMAVISREESYLEETFGPDYLSYKRQVRRWI